MTVATPIAWTGETPQPITPIGSISGVGAFGLTLFQSGTQNDARTLLGVNVDLFGATTITVGTTGKYTTVKAALTAITDASSTKRYLLLLTSNTTESSAITWKDYVFCDLNGFKITITDTSAAAGITVDTSTTNACFFNGEIFRTTSTLANTVTLRVSSASGSTVRFANLWVQNNINAYGCHAIVCENGCNALFQNLLTVFAQINAAASILIKNTAAPSFQNCQLRGAIVCNAALPQFVSCVNSGVTGIYAPTLATYDASVTRIINGHWSFEGTNRGIQANNGSSIFATGLFLHNTPSIKTSTSITATTSITQAGQITSVGLDVLTAGSSGATLKLGTTAGGNEILTDTLVDTIGTKSITLALQPSGSGTVYATVTGTGLIATLDITSINQAADCYAIVLNGTGSVVFDSCSIQSNALSHAVYVSALSASANKAKFNNCTVRVIQNTTNTTSAGFYCPSIWIDAYIKNCTVDAVVAYSNVLLIVDVAINTIQRKRVIALMSQLASCAGQAVITNDDQIMVWGSATNNANAATYAIISQTEGTTGIPQPMKCNGVKTGTWIKVTATRYNVAGVTSAGELWISGDNSVGQLGLGDTTNTGLRYRVMHKVTITGKTIVNVWLGGGDSTNASVYALTTDGLLYSWGYNFYGQLGVNNTTNYSSPQLMAIPAGSSNPQELSVSQVEQAHVLVRTSDGKLHVCGYNNLGQLGLGDTVQRNILTTVSGKTVTAVQACGTFDGASTYYNWSQIILTNGSLQSAGSNVNGQLGNNTTTNSTTFINTTLNHTNVASLVKHVGGYTTSGYITSAGILWLCGHNTTGTLGVGNTTQSNVYVQPSGSFQGFVSKAIIAGTQSVGTCMLMTTIGTNQAWAMGGYSSGLIIANSFPSLTSGEVWATGGNGSGQCGDGSTTTRTTFGRVAMPDLIVDISASAISTASTAPCMYALGANGRLYSWGTNSSLFGWAGQGHLQAVYVPCEALIR